MNIMNKEFSTQNINNCIEYAQKNGLKNCIIQNDYYENVTSIIVLDFIDPDACVNFYKEFDTKQKAGYYRNEWEKGTGYPVIRIEERW